MISIVIVGKPNVGKSTLFNTMLGRKEAITGKDYGLTRDYQEAVCTHKGLTFKLIDTAGYNIKKDIFIDKLNQLTLSQIKNANIILFLIDGSNNLTADDNEIWKLLNKSGKKVILLVNKSELNYISKIYLIRDKSLQLPKVTSLSVPKFLVQGKEVKATQLSLIIDKELKSIND